MNWATLIVALSAAIAAASSAYFAWKAVQTSRIAALLNSVPMLVPWIDAGTGSVTVVNRGGSTSHNLSWYIKIGGEKIAEDKDKLVINPIGETHKSRPLQLSQDQHARIHDWHRRKRQKALIVECRYLASWGQEFVTTRVYPAHSDDSKITIIDEKGNTLRL